MIYRIYHLIGSNHRIGSKWEKTFETDDKSAFDEQVMLDNENGAIVDTEIIKEEEKK